MRLVIDFETLLIGKDAISPRPVCLTYYLPDLDEKGIVVGPDMEFFLASVLPETTLLVGHNLAFDLGVAWTHFQALRPLLLQTLEDLKGTDTKIRERLLNLADFGEVDFELLPDGTFKEAAFSLADLVKKYLHVDISKVKESKDSWRFQYEKLLAVPLQEWPQEAVSYAVQDCVYTWQVYTSQDQREQSLRTQIGYEAVLCTETLRTFLDFCLNRVTAQGMRIDKAQVKKKEEELAAILDTRNFQQLIDMGILVPASPPSPYARGTKDHAEGCPSRKKTKLPCPCPPKLKAAKEEAINQKALILYLQNLALELGVELDRTAPTERHPAGKIRTSKDVIEELSRHSPVLERYYERQKVQKLVTTEIPRLKWEGEIVDFVHPGFDCLKNTGRMSSSASKLWPSLNVQNIDPRIRPCFVPRPGKLLLSVDLSQMELCTTAQTCLNLLGTSVLAQRINQGVDVHAYLGAQICYHLEELFYSTCPIGKDEEKYKFFLELKKCGDPELEALFKKYRKFAKPVNLGFPGGMGPDTFVTYAHASYGVSVDRDTAEQLKNVWMRTYPEMQGYFRSLDRCRDPRHAEHFRYFSPMGMLRSRCDYCACANGQALQTPAAEAMMLIAVDLVPQSLRGAPWDVLALIHDEALVEVPEDLGLANEAAERIAELMKAAVAKICPAITIRTEATLMRHWVKGLDGKYEDGRLVPSN